MAEALERAIVEAFLGYLKQGDNRLLLFKLLNSGATVTPSPEEVEALVTAFVERKRKP